MRERLLPLASQRSLDSDRVWWVSDGGKIKVRRMRLDWDSKVTKRD